MVLVNCSTGTSAEPDDEVHVDDGAINFERSRPHVTLHLSFYTASDPIVREDPPLNCRNFQLHSDPCGLRNLRKNPLKEEPNDQISLNRPQVSQGDQVIQTPSR